VCGPGLSIYVPRRNFGELQTAGSLFLLTGILPMVSAGNKYPAHNHLPRIKRDKAANYESYNESDDTSADDTSTKNYAKTAGDDDCETHHSKDHYQTYHNNYYAQNHYNHYHNHY
jgi:hypothetical protein